LNRIDDIIVFQELTTADVKLIAELLLNRVREQLKEQDLRLDVRDAAMEVLVKEGFDPSLGARPLRRAITRLIENPVSEAILRGQFTGGHVIVVDEKEGRLIFEVREDTEMASIGADS
jgi:ATP-dependent Clp protease ATP-binding subunit ClpC